MTRRTQRLRALAVPLAVAGTLTAVPSALAATGTPDVTWGDHGVASVFGEFGGFIEEDAISTQDAQGRVLVADTQSSKGNVLTVARLLADGTPDPTFNDGQAHQLFVPGGPIRDMRVVGGKIMILTSDRYSTYQHAYLMRLNDDGSVDETLNDEGSYLDLGGATYGDDQDCGDVIGGDIASDGRIDVEWDCDGALGAHRVFDKDGQQLGETETIGEDTSGRLYDASANESGEVRTLGNLFPNRTRGIQFSTTVVFDGTGVIAEDENDPEAIDLADDNSFVLAGADLNSDVNAWRFAKYAADGDPVDGFGTHGEEIVENDQLGYGDDPGDYRRPGVRHLSQNAAGEIIAVGDEGGQEVPSRANVDGLGTATVRLHADGQPDAGWGEGGVKFIDPPDNSQFDYEFGGPALFLADKSRVIVPLAVPDSRSFRGTDPAEHHISAFRFGDPPAAPQQQQAQPPAATPATQVAQSQSAPKVLRTCLSRRSFTIRIRPRKRHIVSAKVTVAGKKVKVTRKHGRLTATVNLRKLKQATFSVRVTAKDSKGHTYRETRRYRTCRVGDGGRKVTGGSTIITVGH